MNATACLSSVIGDRIKSERQAHGWTLDRLAEAASVGRRTLVNVEQGTANPSIGILLRLSDALGVGLPALVEPPETAAVKVVRRGEGTALWSSNQGGEGILVGGTGPPDVVELWDWTLGPGDEHGSEPHAPGTMELVQVLAGSVTMTVDGQAFDLAAGDAVTFPGDVRHSYVNPERKAARFTLVVFEPKVGAAARGREGNDG